MDDWGKGVFGVIGAIVGVAVIALAFSAKANTANVVTSFFGGLSNLIGVAISPVTGQTVAGLTAQGMSMTGLTGTPQAWYTPVGSSTGSSGGLTASGAMGTINGLLNLGNGASNLFGNSGLGSGFVDSGAFDTGSAGSAIGGLIDTTSSFA